MVRAQTQATRSALDLISRYNQIGEVTPYGEMTYEGQPGEEGYRRVISLSPEDQQRLDQQRQLGLALGGFTSDTLLPQAQGVIGTAPISQGDLLSGAQDVERATYERGLGLLEPQFEEQSRDIDTMLQSRGIPIGSIAYERERDRLSRSQNEALGNLALESVGAGRQEQSRLLSADQARRSQAINELVSTMAGTPITQAPQFAPPAQYGPMPADVGAAQMMDYQQQMGRYNQQAAGIGGLFNVAGRVAGSLPWQNWL